jgi:hypothetical protein
MAVKHGLHVLRRHRTSALILVLGIVLGTVGRSVYADPEPPQQGPDTEPLAVTTARGGLSDWRAVARGDSATVTTSTSFVPIPGASQTVVVPANVRALITARFTGESACYQLGGPGAATWCSVRLVISRSGVPPVEMQPASGFDFAFDSTNVGADGRSSWESHSVERSHIVPAVSATVTWVIQAQYGTTSQNTELRLDDWHLTVEKARIP